MWLQRHPTQVTNHPDVATQPGTFKKVTRCTVAQPRSGSTMFGSVRDGSPSVTFLPNSRHINITFQSFPTFQYLSTLLRHVEETQRLHCDWHFVPRGSSMSNWKCRNSRNMGTYGNPGVVPALRIYWLQAHRTGHLRTGSSTSSGQMWAICIYQ